MFRGVKTTPKGSTTRIYVETKDATAGMVIANDGKPLTPEQRQAEQAPRLERFVNNPDELQKTSPGRGMKTRNEPSASCVRFRMLFCIPTRARKRGRRASGRLVILSSNWRSGRILTITDPQFISVDHKQSRHRNTGKQHDREAM